MYFQSGSALVVRAAPHQVAPPHEVPQHVHADGVEGRLRLAVDGQLEGIDAEDYLVGGVLVDAPLDVVAGVGPGDVAAGRNQDLAAGLGVDDVQPRVVESRVPGIAGRRLDARGFPLGTRRLHDGEAVLERLALGLELRRDHAAAQLRLVGAAKDRNVGGGGEARQAGEVSRVGVAAVEVDGHQGVAVVAFGAAVGAVHQRQLGHGGEGGGLGRDGHQGGLAVHLGGVVRAGLGVGRKVVENFEERGGAGGRHGVVEGNSGRRRGGGRPVEEGELEQQGVGVSGGADHVADPSAPGAGPGGGNVHVRQLRQRRLRRRRRYACDPAAEAAVLKKAFDAVGEVGRRVPLRVPHVAAERPDEVGVAGDEGGRERPRSATPRKPTVLVDTPPIGSLPPSVSSIFTPG